jgi:hypothetical protein
MIEAKIIADSLHKQTGTRLTTFEVTFPRWILSELNTHRQLSRNSASSRAIPIQANIDNILNDTAIPVSWGKNQAGMVADADVDEVTAKLAKEIWLDARDNAIKSALKLSELGIHKQISNRLIENFTYQKVVVTSTEWDNFFWLRAHKDAQPEIKILAEMMLKSYNESTPIILSVGEYHVPYVDLYRDMLGLLHYLDSNGTELSIENALKISSSCCAQISYRKNDDSLEKAQKVFDMLNLYDDTNETRSHSSPTEHQATPIDYDYERHCCSNDYRESWKGVTHEDLDGNLWSGNFKDFIQYRHLILNESCKKHPDIIVK